MAADIRSLLADIEPRSWFGLRGWPARAAAIAGVAVILALAGIVVLRPKNGSAPAVGPKPIKVLIADFDNKTGDPVFDGALEQTFGISLEGASFITLYDRGQPSGRGQRRHSGRDRAGKARRRLHDPDQGRGPH
jgi:hypothetical protein